MNVASARAPRTAGAARHCRRPPRATMWCVAPSSLEHARRRGGICPPVIMASALSGVVDDPTGVLRPSRPGDILCAVSTGGYRCPRRCGALCGDSPRWIGAGTPDARADHVLGGSGGGRHALMGIAAARRQPVLRYHVLWELTHVLRASGSACRDGAACDTRAHHVARRRHLRRSSVDVTGAASAHRGASSGST